MPLEIYYCKNGEGDIRYHPLMGMESLTKFDFTVSNFPNGEFKVIGPEISDVSYAVFRLVATSADNDIYVLSSLLQNYFICNITPVVHLIVDGISYDRQDKSIVLDEADANGNKLMEYGLGSNLYCSNMFSGFESVYITDPHNKHVLCLADDSVSAIIKHDIINTYLPQVRDIIHGDNIQFVVPDKGALAEINNIKQATNNDKPLLLFDKKRDNNGNIISIDFTNPEDVDKSCDYIVMDDICDGGGTFMGIPDHLKTENNKIYLYVTRGYFSKGKESLLLKYDRIFCYINYKDYKYHRGDKVWYDKNKYEPILKV